MYLYLTTKHWTISNLFGLIFCTEGIAELSVGSYYVGACLLGGLFFYDIFWVFKTDVMVTVAKKFDAPIKLMFPYINEEAELKYSMLGLGDIVIPGVFIALLLRFDYHRLNNAVKTWKDRIYFSVTLLFYCIGLAVCVFIMYGFHHAQV